MANPEIGEVGFVMPDKSILPIKSDMMEEERFDFVISMEIIKLGTFCICPTQNYGIKLSFTYPPSENKLRQNKKQGVV
jgi:hypothetical protein